MATRKQTSNRVQRLVYVEPRSRVPGGPGILQSNAHTHTHMHAHTHTHMHTPTPTCIDTHTCAQVHSDMHRYTHRHTQMHTDTHRHTCTRTHTHTHTSVVEVPQAPAVTSTSNQTRTHAHMHTHIHTYTHIHYNLLLLRFVFAANRAHTTANVGCDAHAAGIEVVQQPLRPRGHFEFETFGIQSPKVSKSKRPRGQQTKAGRRKQNFALHLPRRGCRKTDSIPPF